MAIAALGLIASSVIADEEKPRERPPRDGEARQQILERFDKDGDGKLSEDERHAARKARERDGRGRSETRRGDRPRRDGERRDEARRGEGRGRQARGGEARRGEGRGRGGEARRGGDPRGEGRRGPGRPDGPRDGGRSMFDPERIFNRIDTNGDGEISREEFTRSMERMRPLGPPRGFGERRGGPDSSRFRGGPGGPGRGGFGDGPRVRSGGPGGPDGFRFGRRPEGTPSREGRPGRPDGGSKDRE